MATVQPHRHQERRDTTANWTSVNPVLADGETGYDTDLHLYKMGNGIAVWTDLPWMNRGPGGELAIGTVDVGVADANVSGSFPDQKLNLTLPQGPTGPMGNFDIGTVTQGGTADASISGSPPNQLLNLVLPEGQTGPAGSITNGVTVRNHGGNASRTRPAGAAIVLWVGTVEPVNATDNDLWVDES